MSDFLTEIKAIGLEFKDMFVGIPDRVSTVAENLPIAIIGILIVLFELALIAVLILLISMVIRALEGIKASAAPAGAAPTPASVPAPAAGVPLPDGQSQGKLDLVDVDEPTAATIMAVVSDRSGIPLNRLNFKSIKRIED